MKRYRRNTALTYKDICQKWDQMIDDYGLRDTLGSKLAMLCNAEDEQILMSMIELLSSFGDEALCELLTLHSDGQISLNFSLPCVQKNPDFWFSQFLDLIVKTKSSVWTPFYEAGKMRWLNSYINEFGSVGTFPKTRSYSGKFRKILTEFSEMVLITPTDGLKPFYIGKYEVTQALWYDQYEGVKTDIKIKSDPSYFKGSTRPVEQVNWIECLYFCNLLSLRSGLEPVYTIKDEDKVKVKWNKKANGFRLPTVAEWDYAAKGQQNYRYAGSDRIDEVAWYKKNSNQQTHGVGQLYPNDFGLYDMSGNVFEWCWDTPKPRFRRAKQGGTWDHVARFSQLSQRFTSYALYHLENTGFRLARNMD